ALCIACCTDYVPHSNFRGHLPRDGRRTIANETFAPPIHLNTDLIPELPPTITTRREDAELIERLQTCGIQRYGGSACLENSTDMVKWRVALGTVVERYGFLDRKYVAACGYS